MTPERWRRVEELYHAALTRDEDARAAFLGSACGGDEALRREVESLLAQHASNAGFLDGVAVTAAAQLTTVTGASLLTSRRLGPYQIQERIGVGGMGEVYRARDTKLGRDVAIKLLPASFTNDPGRLARFEREARVLASLNHPHISAIYGLEDADGVRALVLELVDGETLGERIARGPIPVSETLTIARQIAEALEAAHEKGIVHRDLKPPNIKITPDGVVKVLDFGLAKATANDMTVGTTQDGVILGTASYMSPEQAKGRSADKRADVWAFGVVLYEMLTGRLAFSGDTISDVLAKVIEREPDWSALPASAPPRLRDLVRRCVRKDLKHRLQAIGDARIQIEEMLSGVSDDSALRVAEQPRAQRGLRLAWSVAAVLLIITAALALPAMWYFRYPTPAPLVTRFEIPTPTTSDPVSFALSADGRQLAFVATAEDTPRLWVRPLDQVTAQPLPSTEGARYPFWAPDGSAIGFFADGKLKRIDLGSKVAQILADAGNGRGGTENSDGVIVFAPDGGGGLMRVPATGGAAVPATHLAPDQGSHRWPQFLPGGRHFLFFGGRGLAGTTGIYVGALDGGDPKSVLTLDSAAVYAPPGVLLWVNDGVLIAQRFDPVHVAVSGQPIPVAHGVGLDEGIYRGAFTVSANGVLAHRPSRGEKRQLTWVDRDGITRGTVGPPDENGMGMPELASDGRRVAIHRTVEVNTDIYVIDTGGLPSRFTFHPSLDTGAIWSPDGKRVVFSSSRNGAGALYQKAASGAGDEQPLTAPGGPKSPLSWSPDGQLLLYSTRDSNTGVDLWALPMTGDRKPFAVLQTRFDETGGQFSPDGRFVAYQSNESKVVQIYVRPFRGPGGPWQVSTAGGSEPRWRPDGNELFYVEANTRLMAAPIAVGVDQQTVKVGTPIALFKARMASGANINSGGGGARAGYAVASDGRFLMNLAVEPTPSPITVVLNWDTALKR